MLYHKRNFSNLRFLEVPFIDEKGYYPVYE